MAPANREHPAFIDPLRLASLYRLSGPYRLCQEIPSPIDPCRSPSPGQEGLQGSPDSWEGGGGTCNLPPM